MNKINGYFVIIFICFLPFSVWGQKKLIEKAANRINEKITKNVSDIFKEKISEKVKGETNTILEDLLNDPKFKDEMKNADPEILDAQNSFNKDFLKSINKGLDTTFAKENLKFDWEIKKEREKNIKDEGKRLKIINEINFKKYENSLQQAINEGKLMFISLTHDDFDRGEKSKSPFELDGAKELVKNEHEILAYLEQNFIIYKEFTIKNESSPFLGKDYVFPNNTYVMHSSIYIYDPIKKNIIYTINGYWLLNEYLPKLKEIVRIYNELESSKQEGKEILFFSDYETYSNNEESKEKQTLEQFFKKYNLTNSYKIITTKFDLNEVVTYKDTKTYGKIFIGEYDSKLKLKKELSTNEYKEDKDMFFRMLGEENINTVQFKTYTDEYQLFNDVKASLKPVIILGSKSYNNDRDYSKLLLDENIQRYLDSEYIILKSNENTGFLKNVKMFSNQNGITFWDPFTNNIEVFGSNREESFIDGRYSGIEFLKLAKSFKTTFLQTREAKPQEWKSFGLKPDVKGIKFSEGSWDEIKTKAKKEKKPVFLYVYASWSGHCKIMENMAFVDPELSEFYNQSFLCYKINGDEGETSNLNANERTKIIEILSRLSKRNGTAFPSFYFLSKDDLNLLEYVEGVRTSTQLINIGKLHLNNEK